VDEQNSTEFDEWVAETIPQDAQYWFYFLKMFGQSLAPCGLVSPWVWHFCKTYMRDRKELL